eukprot:TRINITY_DN1955_c0_g1_i18.p1 TRINITY_DN1955_c0_g1~~TRINITY_DN1955_c0_g1_i18.p1  ORF type:complete len:368 (+),score=72.17 TRINITY_DN1955_c0_g1_i18:421-1524(+)
MLDTTAPTLPPLYPTTTSASPGTTASSCAAASASAACFAAPAHTVTNWKSPSPSTRAACSAAAATWLCCSTAFFRAACTCSRTAAVCCSASRSSAAARAVIVATSRSRSAVIWRTTAACCVSMYASRSCTPSHLSHTAHSTQHNTTQATTPRKQQMTILAAPTAPSNPFFANTLVSNLEASLAAHAAGVVSPPRCSRGAVPEQTLWATLFAGATLEPAGVDAAVAALLAEACQPSVARLALAVQPDTDAGRVLALWRALEGAVARGLVGELGLHGADAAQVEWVAARSTAAPAFVVVPSGTAAETVDGLVALCTASGIRILVGPAADTEAVFAKRSEAPAVAWVLQYRGIAERVGVIAQEGVLFGLE